MGPGSLTSHPARDVSLGDRMPAFGHTHGLRQRFFPRSGACYVELLFQRAVPLVNPTFRSVDNSVGAVNEVATLLSMRWDSLFDDLESQLEHELHAEEQDRRAEDHRLRLGRLTLRDRLQTFSGKEGQRGEVVLELVTGSTLIVLPQAFGRDWMSGDVIAPGGASAACVVPLSAITGMLVPKASLARSLAVPERNERGPRLSDRIGLSFVLRDLCRRRVYVRLHDARNAGSVHGGTLDRVAGDHVDLAVHEQGAPRRERNVSHLRIVPLTGIGLIEL
jgi:hypothetical protein